VKAIGLIGGMSWESTRIYYEHLNRGVQQRLGGLHSARVIIASLDFAPIALMQAEGRWQEAGDVLACAARALERAGAAVIALATNTMHKVATAIVDATGVPFLDIADPLAFRLVKARKSRPLLLATQFTMEDRFLIGRLAARGITTIVPSQRGRELLQRIIYDELCKGVVTDASRVRELVDEGVASGADCVILGCTELCMLIGEYDFNVPVYDTTAIHAAALVEFSVNDREIQQ
jgi:aspartate racemase